MSYINIFPNDVEILSIYFFLNMYLFVEYPGIISNPVEKSFNSIISTIAIDKSKDESLLAEVVSTYNYLKKIYNEIPDIPIYSGKKNAILEL